MKTRVKRSGLLLRGMILVLLLGPPDTLFGASPSATGGGSIPFETLDRGEVSGFRYGDPDFLGGEMVIRDRTTWEWFWVKHTEEIKPAPPVPRVDFGREMILVILLGFQTSGGKAGVEIVSIEELITQEPPRSTRRTGPKAIVVSIDENREPGPLNIITNPYHIALLGKRDFSVLFQHQPMGNSCISNASCQEKEFCQKNVGDCGGPGVCKVRPEACILIYDPVCACDGKTYGNACGAAQAGVSVLHPGECQGAVCMRNEECGPDAFCLFPEGKCSGPGVCTPRPRTCPLYFAPCRLEDGICGCDGISYCNACEANRKGVSISHQGQCQQECVQSGGKITPGMCCQSTADFPNTCTIGPCGCSPENSHSVAVCDCGPGHCFDGIRCVPRN